MRSRVNMVDEAQLCSTNQFNSWSVGCVMYSRALSWRTGPFLSTNADCKHWSRPPNSDQDLFFCCQFSFGKDFGASFWSNHWAGRCWLSYKIHFSSHVTIWSRNGSLLLQRIRDDTSKWYFLICGQLMRHSLIQLSHLANLLQIPNDHRTVDTEFFRNFLFSCERRSFDHCS